MENNRKPYYNATAPRPKGENKEGQVTGTPWDFFNVLNDEFGFAYDLAASTENTKCSQYITEEEDSLTVDWHLLAPDRWHYLNPPFANMTPWVSKCKMEMDLGAKIALLTRASVDTQWYADFVEQFTERRWPTPRLKFLGHTTTYPVPVMLSLFETGREVKCFQWRWKLDGRRKFLAMQDALSFDLD